jgi:hypothetical protein
MSVSSPSVVRERVDLEIVGILWERHPDHIILSNGTQIFLGEGVSADHVPVGRSLTVECSVQHGKQLAVGIRLNPDWLLDSVEALSLGN